MKWTFITWAVVLALVLIGIVMFRLFVFDANEPEVLPLPPAASGSGPASRGDTIERVELNRENVASVISTLERTKNYYRQITLSKFDGKEYHMTNYEVWASGENYRIKEHAQGMPVKNTLILGNYMWGWYEGSEGYLSIDLSGLPYSQIDSFVGMTTYEDVLGIPPEDILDAGFTTDGNKEPCIFVAFRSGRFGYRRHLYISQSTGLLMAEGTYDKDILIFDIVCGRQTVIPQDDDGYFSLPSWIQ